MTHSQKVIVTGGAGMIGSNLVKRLVSQGHRVIVIDNLWRGKLKNLNDNNGVPVIDMENDFFNIDLTSNSDDFTHIFEGADYIYHLADIVAGIDYVFNNEGSVFRNNLLINSNIINTVKRFPPKGFIYAGTACSFPAHLQNENLPRQLKESDQYPAAPESAYGWSKLMGEYEALLMEKETGIPVCVISIHNVYGPQCDFSERRSQVIPSLIRKAIQYPDKPFTVWGDGNQSRAFVHIKDTVEAFIAAKDKGLGHGVIQIGPDKPTPIKEIADIVVHISNKSIDVEYDTSNLVGDRGRCADFTKATKILGWKPKIALKNGIEELYAWIEKQIEDDQTTNA